MTEGNRPRCTDCNHKRGPRYLGPKVQGSGGQRKKASCNCGCHNTPNYSNQLVGLAMPTSGGEA